MKRLAVLTLGVLFAANVSMADTGWLGSFAYTWDSVSNADTWYDLNEDVPAHDDFDGADLGTFWFTGDSLFLNAEINAWADGGDTYENFSLWWRIDDGTWTQASAPEITNPDGNDYRGVVTGIDLIDAVDSEIGEYDISVILSRTHNWGGEDTWSSVMSWDGDEIVYSNDTNMDVADAVSTLGGGFTASFEIIPEPGTMGLLAIGLLGIAGLRRRMK